MHVGYYKTKRRDGNCLRNKSRDFLPKGGIWVKAGEVGEGGGRDNKDVILLTKSKHRQAGEAGGHDIDLKGDSQCVCLQPP